MMSNERRRFFRIDDRLEVRLIRKRDEDDQGETPPGVSAMRESAIMIELDTMINDMIDEVRERAPEASELSDLLNRKLDFVIDALELNEELEKRFEFREHEVNISACGLAMETRQVLQSGDEVQLDIRFPPTSSELRLEGRVVRSDETKKGFYTVYVDFINLSQDDQEFLIQFVLRRQSVYLKRLREEREAGPRPAEIEPNHQQKPPW